MAQRQRPQNLKLALQTLFSQQPNQQGRDHEKPEDEADDEDFVAADALTHAGVDGMRSDPREARSGEDSHDKHSIPILAASPGPGASGLGPSVGTGAGGPFLGPPTIFDFFSLDKY